MIGGSGDYFEVADTVICMDSFKPKNVTAEAKRIAREIGPPSAVASSSEPYGNVPRRALVSVFDGGVHCCNYLCRRLWCKSTEVRKTMLQINISVPSTDCAGAFCYASSSYCTGTAAKTSFHLWAQSVFEHRV